MVNDLFQHGAKTPKQALAGTEKHNKQGGAGGRRAKQEENPFSVKAVLWETQ